MASAYVMGIPTSAFAQVGPAELRVRIDRMENQIRQLTGEIEQMQYRNQQLGPALKRLQDDNGGSRAATASPGAVPPNQPSMPGRRSDAFDPMESPNAPGTPRSLGLTPPQPAPLMSRRSDAFDPVENPNAPGAPRALGSLPPQAAPMISTQRGIGIEPTPYGAAAGAPANVDPGSGRFPTGAGQRNPGPTSPYAVATAPSSSPRDTLDLGIGYLQRRDYALAEETFRGF